MKLHGVGYRLRAMLNENPLLVKKKIRWEDLATAHKFFLNGHKPFDPLAYLKFMYCQVKCLFKYTERKKNIKWTKSIRRNVWTLFLKIDLTLYLKIS